MPSKSDACEWGRLLPVVTMVAACAMPVSLRVLPVKLLDEAAAAHEHRGDLESAVALRWHSLLLERQLLDRSRGEAEDCRRTISKRIAISMRDLVSALWRQALQMPRPANDELYREAI